MQDFKSGASLTIFYIKSHYLRYTFYNSVIKLIIAIHSRLATNLCQTCGIQICSITLVTITIYCIIIITISLSSTYYNRRKLSQVSHYLGETVIRIDCNQLGRNPNTNPHFPRWGRIRSPLGQLRSDFAGLYSVA